MDLSFSGAGFMGCYYFGVVNCWNKYIPRERVRRVAGASAGSLIAAYYLMDLPLDKCLKEIIELTEDVRKRPLGVFDRSNQIVDVLPRALDKLFPKDAHKRVNGRLYVCITRLKDMKAIVVNEFETRKDLIDALNCSCFIPVWSGNHVSTYKGVKHIDGGFRNNLPCFDEHTIRISCFAGPSDIAPYDRAHLEQLSGSFQGMPFYWTWKNMARLGRALWPPPASYIIELLEKGFQDAKAFILSNDLIQCDKCFGQLEEAHEPIYTHLKNPTISPAVSPAVSRASSYMNLSNALKSTKHEDEDDWSSLEATGRKFPSFRLRNMQNKQEAALAKLAGKEMKLFIEQNNINEKYVAEGAGGAGSVEVNKQAEKKKGRKRVTSFCSNGTSSSIESATDGSVVSNSSSGVFSNNEDFVCSPLDSSKDKKKNKKLSFSAILRAKLSSMTPAGNKKNGKQQTDKCNDSYPVMQAPPSIVVQEPTDYSQEEDIEGKPETIMEIMAKQNEFDNGGQSSSSSGGSSPDQGAADDDDDNSSESTSSTSRVASSIVIKLQRGRQQKLVENQNFASPLDKFVRRMSVTPDQQAENAANEMNGQSAATDSNNSSDNNLLSTSRFAMAPSPLPSCPPSPNLNRHCSECIRMRQEARMDLIDEQIKLQAELYRGIDTQEAEKEYATLAAGGGIKAKLSSLLRSLAGQKTKYTYKLEDHDEPVEIAALS